MSSKNKILKHVAIIMDGNGRWAKERFLPRVLGHKAGVAPVRECIKEALKVNLPILTLFIFSTENWSRPVGEVNAIFNLLRATLKDEITILHKQNVRVTFIGNIPALPEDIKQLIHESELLTKDNVLMNLNLALSYGGRWDIVNVVKNALLDKELIKDELDEASLDKYFNLLSIPDVDLLIRTGKQKRISNFSLWQIAYAEILFSDELWPDFSADSFQEAVDFYHNTDRRFGKINDI
jgi:undecaprenyl diphosphate synthase